MKRLICVLFLTLFSASMLPPPAFPLATAAQVTRSVWEDPWTLTTFQGDGSANSSFYTFPKVIWNGSQFVDYVFNSSEMSAGIGSVYIKVFSDHTVFYDPYRTQQRIGSESWSVEQYDVSSSAWEVDCPLDNNVHSLVNSSGVYFDRTSTLHSGGQLDVWYWLRAGSKLKISVEYHAAKAGESRMVWSLNDLPGHESTVACNNREHNHATRE